MKTHRIIAALMVAVTTAFCAIPQDPPNDRMPTSFDRSYQNYVHITATDSTGVHYLNALQPTVGTGPHSAIRDEAFRQRPFLLTEKHGNTTINHVEYVDFGYKMTLEPLSPETYSISIFRRTEDSKTTYQNANAHFATFKGIGRYNQPLDTHQPVIGTILVNLFPKKS